MLGKIQNRVWVFVAVLAAFMLTLAPAAGAQEGWIQSVDITKLVYPNIGESIFDEDGNQILEVGDFEPLKVTVNFTIPEDDLTTEEDEDPTPAKITVLVKGLGQRHVWTQRIRQSGDYSVSQYLWTDQKEDDVYPIDCILRIKNPRTGELIGTETVNIKLTLGLPE